MTALIGNQNPKVGETNFYEISIFSSLPFFNPGSKYEWYLFKKQKNGNWIDITKNGIPKTGNKVDYTFFEPVAGDLFEIRIFEVKQALLLNTESIKTLYDKLEVRPTASKTGQIDKVVLFNRGKKDVNKADYRDTLIAQAFCTGLFGKEIEFQLWEDDAPGEGHNAEINKNNKIPRVYKAIVNEKGIAEAKISLIADEKIMRQIANKYLMKGDKDEGANYEYYVTATHLGKGEKASQVNVNVANPDYKPKPKENTAKFPATPASKTPKQSDTKGKITDAYFVDERGNKVSKIVLNDSVKVRISSQNMKGKKVQYVIWEYDSTGHDEILRKTIVINHDVGDSPLIKIDTNTFGKGYSTDASVFGTPLDSDSVKQNYFIEVIPLDVSAESKKFGVDSDGLMEVEKLKSPAVVKKTDQPAKNCGGKFCIKKGDKNELVREINIRLSGFGGNVPTDEFTDRTERMVKQFQRDYMKIPETGKVCGNVLRAIDEFQNKYSVDFDEIKCKCKKCTGFGDGSNKGKYLNTKIEAYHRYEYPGVHRSLLSSIRSVKFYLAKDGRYSFNKVNSGYRCRFHPEYLKKPTTNHMGKALDLHFNDKKGRTKEISDMETIRKDIFNKYLGAKWDWKERNIFNLESTAVGATTWVHYDVREFDSAYLDTKFFVKNTADLNGKSIVALAAELGFGNTCSCLGGGIATSKEKDETKKSNKYKWSHSEFGNMIAKKESYDNYNKCNKTEKVAYKVKGVTKYKRVVKEVDSVKVIETTIKEIQKKQEDKDLFAVGRYQLIPKTLNAAVASLKLNIEEKLSEEMQDKIFDEYLIKVKRPKIIAYLENDGTVEDAMYSSAQEWASIGVEKGKRISDKITKKDGKTVVTKRYAVGGESYYAGDGLNNAHITPEQIKTALINSKNANK